MAKKRPGHSRRLTTSTPDGPALEPLQAYCMLNGLDAVAASELFTADAEYRCTVNNQPARFIGRAAIREHLSRTRPDLEHTVTFFRQHSGDECAMAEITIHASDWGKVTETVLVRMRDGLICEFEILW